MPVTATTRPTGAKSNMEKGAPKASERYCAMTMFGGVPIRVIMPPRMVAKDRGIRERPGERSAFLAASISSGMSNASAATLLMIADRLAPTMAMRPICRDRPLEAEITTPAISSTAPEFISPRETISTRAMIMTAEWPKPEKISSEGTRPRNAPRINAPKAMRSKRIRPQTSSAKTVPKRTNRAIWSKVTNRLRQRLQNPGST